MAQQLNDKNGKFQPQQSVNNITVKMDELKDVACVCKGLVFVPVNKYKVLPALLSPSSKPALIPVGCIRCVECGAVFSMEDVMKSIA